MRERHEGGGGGQGVAAFEQTPQLLSRVFNFNLK